MPILTYAGAAYEAAPEETVLDTLLRNGVAVANSCRAGACQSCLLRASQGPVPEAARRGLKSTLAEQGYFLSCACKPEADMVLEPAGGLEVAAAIESLERLSPTVMRVWIRTSEPLGHRAGQYLTLCRPDGLARSYSIANLPNEEMIEIHIRRAPLGRMSGWLFDEARANDRIMVRGPAGDCFYTAGRPDQPLLLAGTGTGLAPLVGIAKDAIKQGHTGPIHLYHGALHPAGLYLRDELRALAAASPHFDYHPTVLEGGGDLIATGPLDQVVLGAHPKLSGWRGFVCGDPAIVNLLRRKFFLAGISSREIFADAFVEATVR